MTMSICLSDAWLTELSSFWDEKLSWAVYVEQSTAAAAAVVYKEESEINHS